MRRRAGTAPPFDVPADGRVPLVGTLALVPRVVDAVDVPVVASGGIMDGRGLAAALALGAQGASLGTRFLLATESAASATDHRATLAGLPETATVVTDTVTGRPARWVRNTLTETLERRARPHRVGTAATGARRHPPRGREREGARSTCRCSPGRERGWRASSRRRRSSPRSPPRPLAVIERLAELTR